MPKSEGSPTQTTEGAATVFGALVTRLAKEAGYDVTPNAGGRAKLAAAMGMSVSAISRNLDGVSFPRPTQFAPWARALNVPVRTLLVQGGLISAEDWPESAVGAVRSVTPSPGAIADSLGIHDPMIRGMLIGGIEQAQRLQREADGQAANAGGS